MTLYRSAVTLLVVVFVGGLICSSCNPDPDKAVDRKRAEEIAVDLLAKKYNAVRVMFDGTKEMRFTFQFEKALAKNGGQPVVCEGFLEDIRTQSGALVAEFAQNRPVIQVRFLLKCSSDQAARLVSEDSYFVTFVAKILSVENGNWALDAAGDAPHEVRISSEPMVVARGELLDFCIQAD
jgi:hypothetical protein